jgi:hypothetical protein
VVPEVNPVRAILTAFIPVCIGDAPDILAAPYAAMATGGVIEERLA